MKKIVTLLFCIAYGFGTQAQTTITNGNFEAWGNTTPGVSSEPTNWFSNKSGSTIASLGPQTCFKDMTVVHGGTASVRLESITYIGSVVNGNVTTGVVNAPTTSKSDGYIGTVNFTTSTDVRRMSFTGRPDSIVGWYQYTQGGALEQGKVRVILHTGDYFDPETPTTYHANPTANKIADGTFLTPLSNVATWTRFSFPLTYVSSSAPAYIMINATSSANQLTTVAGSKIWLDDIQAVYNSTTGITNNSVSENDFLVYSFSKTIFVGCNNKNGEASNITVYDLAGKQVFSEKMTNDRDYSFNLSDLTSGIYLYRLSSDGVTKNGKLFIY